MKKRTLYASLFFVYSLCSTVSVIEGHEQHRDEYDLYDRNREGRDFSEYDYGSPEEELHRNSGGYFYRRHFNSNPYR